MGEHGKLGELKSPQYENCEVLSPDGQLMFRCPKKKVLWYLNRNLAIKTADDPLTIKLTFTPGGLGYTNQPYFLQTFYNRCVVCGSETLLTKHHVVPSYYRRFLPEEFKKHRSYDVVSLCIPCHRVYERYAEELKDYYINKYSVKFKKYNRELGQARSSSKAILVHGHKMTPERREFLLAVVRNFLQKEPTLEDLKNLLVENPHPDFKIRGKSLIDKVEDIEAFIKEWRQHFLDKMNPQFMPKGWGVNYPGEISQSQNP